jgi:hypothetical protein
VLGVVAALQGHDTRLVSYYYYFTMRRLTYQIHSCLI